jgi:hypothetical protein
VIAFLPKRPILQIEASGVASNNKNEGAPLHGVQGADERVSPLLLQELPLVVLDDNQAAFDEQKRLNITPKKRCRRGGVGGRDRNASSVKAGKKAMAKLVAKQISALTTRVQDVEKK